jgi:hypothetical protein
MPGFAPENRDKWRNVWLDNQQELAYCNAVMDERVEIAARILPGKGHQKLASQVWFP